MDPGNCWHLRILLICSAYEEVVISFHVLNTALLESSAMKNLNLID